MREILFRGKNFGGEWEYGVPVFCGVNNELAFMKQMHSYDHRVLPETVGQFTGLTDKNGKKIFEGDIVAYCWYEDEPMNFQIEFVSGEFLAVPINKREDVWAIRISGQGENLDVIGNIHDNPELLNGGLDGEKEMG